MDEQRWLTFDLFADRVGEQFSMVIGGADGEALPVELVEAKEYAELGGPGPRGEQRRQFSLVFVAGSGSALPQATYRLEHAELGALELFLVPLGSDAAGTRYEAAFG